MKVCAIQSHLTVPYTDLYLISLLPFLKKFMFSHLPTLFRFFYFNAAILTNYFPLVALPISCILLLSHFLCVCFLSLVTVCLILTPLQNKK